jgi:tetratricopeptide (TPR) repeat protein
MLAVLLGQAPPAQLPDLSPSAERLWDQGQEAMRQGHADEAIACYRRSLATDPELSRNHLSLAAAYIEKGDANSACAALGRYVSANPDQVGMRIHLADLLLRLERVPEAQDEYERSVAGAQEQEDGVPQLIHCHTRLMEIAETAEDAYAEHLHRGIGLYLLARQRAALEDAETELPPEALLCKAAGELTLAKLERPDEARPCWYLYEVWSRLAQRPAAQRCLREAREAAPFSYLTAFEKRALRLDSQCAGVDHSAK